MLAPRARKNGSLGYALNGRVVFARGVKLPVNEYGVKSVISELMEDFSSDESDSGRKYNCLGSRSEVGIWISVGVGVFVSGDVETTPGLAPSGHGELDCSRRVQRFKAGGVEQSKGSANAPVCNGMMTVIAAADFGQCCSIEL